MTLSRILLSSLVLGIVASGCGAPVPGETIGQTSEAITFANDQPAFDYFRAKGLTAVQAAGIVGNLDQESGVDPTAVEQGGPGRGIAQWSVGGRWDTDSDDNATWYASKEGLPLLSLQLQLDFIWYELTTFSGYGLADLQAATTVSAATIAFETDFEACGECDQSTRIMYAENVLAAFGGDVVDGGAADVGSSSEDAGATTCTVSTTNEMGVCLDTSVCGSSGGTSTPGYCPGPDDIQCCTGLPVTTGHDAGTTASADAGGAHHAAVDAGDDASHPVTPHSSDAGGGKSSHGSSSARREEDAGDDDDAGLGSGSSGGCSVASSPAEGAPWLIALGCIPLLKRRRRHEGACSWRVSR
jgi:hypothetical protein